MGMLTLLVSLNMKLSMLQFEVYKEMNLFFVVHLNCEK